MVHKKKIETTTAAGLQSKSELALAAFKNLIDGLRTTNEEAAAAKLENEEKIATLQAENAAIIALSEKNARIVQNVEHILELG